VAGSVEKRSGAVKVAKGYLQVMRLLVLSKLVPRVVGVGDELIGVCLVISYVRVVGLPDEE
jgi:hypothetical protein